jgi:hypothetical protein
MPRPAADEYAPFYAGYVNLVPEDDVLAAMNRQTKDVIPLLRSVSEETSKVVHAPSSWSVKQVVGHLGDGERVFGYRAMCVSRGDENPLPGFDENAYMDAADFDRYSYADLVDQFEALRRANVVMFQHLTAKAWGRWGTVWEKPITVRAQAYILVGHVWHHANILRRRLGK